MVENHIHRPHLIAKLNHRLQRPLTLVSAPAGYGKTMLVSNWLEAGSRPGAWVSLDKDDNDWRLFLSYFLTAIQSCHGTEFADVGRKTLAMINAITLPPASVLAANLINELDRIEQPFTLVLDDFHHIEDESVFLLLDQLLHHPPQAMHLVLISRRDPLLAISKMRAKSLLTEIRIQDLRFNKAETVTFLTQELGTQVDLATADALEEKNEGWVTGLRLAVLSMRHRGNLDPRLLEPQVDAQYVMEYLFVEVFSQQPPEINQYLMNTAILDRLYGPLCEAVFMPGAEPFAGKIGGWEFIAWLKKENIFLIPLDAENRWFRFHHLFQKLLLNQLQRHCSPEDINALHAQASSWFAENGLIEEALKHALAGGNSKAATQLIAKHGFDLVSEEQWLTLERWLNMLPNDIRIQDPGLVILVAWTHLVSSRDAEMMSCLDRAKALFSAQPYPPAATKHLLGHLEAMRALQYYYAAEGERALIHAQRANENIPIKHRYPRILISLIRAVAYQMIGDSEKAQSTIEEMTRDETLRGGISEGYLLASPCFVYWIEADLTAMLQTVARLQKIDAVLQNPWTLGHGLHFSGIANYHRNELHKAEEKLLPLVKAPYLHHVWNFAHSAFALALIYQARGRADEANEVAESVVTYALDTKNTAALKIARAFQAELALRQGRLAEASHWAGNFVAKPFAAMYRFYVPQFTLVSVLLAQDTTDSREQAADLLKQLYDFVVYIHNTRFQIDVLALQALLCDTRGEGPAALESLTHAVELAEPGGFIRLFVDIGPQMADLLKRLQKQNVAVGYIERILAAFRKNGHRTVPEATDHESPSPPHPISPSPPLPTAPSLHPLLIPPSLRGVGPNGPYGFRLVERAYSSERPEAAFPIPPSTTPPVPQPLVEPLTNRELDVMDLLAQRLSNKEIAAKLFISATTVKGHLQNIYEKLNVSKRREAVEKALMLGIVKR